MKIYLVAGKSGSGKGEVAKIINEYYLSLNQKPIITSFSKYIKMYAKEIIGWDGNEPKPRKFLLRFRSNDKRKIWTCLCFCK